MKKTALIILSIAILLSSCAPAPQPSASAGVSSPVATASLSPSAEPTNAPESSPTPAPSATPESTQGIEVDKGLLMVEITLPKSLFGADADFETIKKDALSKGIADVKQNPDGSITYKMTRIQHEKMLSDQKEQFKTTFDDMIKGGEYESIKKVEANDDFTELTVTVDKKKYESSMDGLALLAAYISAGYYQAFNGVKDIKVTCKLLDEKTNKVFNTVVYPPEE